MIKRWLLYRVSAGDKQTSLVRSKLGARLPLTASTPGLPATAGRRGPARCL